MISLREKKKIEKECPVQEKESKKNMAAKWRAYFKIEGKIKSAKCS